jgi:hypothetical protein
MRTTSYLNQLMALGTAVMVGGTMSSRASVDLTLNLDADLWSSAVGLTSPDGTVLPVNEFAIGEYGFTVNSIDPATAALTGLTIGSTFNSICLSPSGTLNSGTPYNYNFQSFSASSPGYNPGGYWSANGIQNAAYLWNLYGGTVTSGDQGAGLSLAMLEVLYDGGLTYGTLNPTLTTYAPNFGSDSAAQTWYNYYINQYTTMAGSSGPLGEAANIETYGLFVPTSDPQGDGTSGQEFIFISPNQSNVAVPEPTTILAGVLVLLPFGASTLKVLRKRSTTP